MKNNVIRHFATINAFLVLCLAFGYGKCNAGLILESKNGTVSTKIFKESQAKEIASTGLLLGQDRLKYLGKAGDYFFFLSLDDSKTYIVKNDAVYFVEFDLNKK